MLTDSNKHPWIKICGLTQPENALECARLGANAIGLVFFQKSPRNVTSDQAIEITQILPDHVQPIGVFVNASYSEIMKKVDSCNLKGVQLHGNESPDLINRLKSHDLVVIKALFAEKKPKLNQAGLYSHSHFLLVEYGKGILPGGNAETWDYRLIQKMKSKTPIVLAGGLSTKNVRQAIIDAKPDGVDISSGVEKEFGIKDLNKVKTFITQVKSVAS